MTTEELNATCEMVLRTQAMFDSSTCSLDRRGMGVALAGDSAPLARALLAILRDPTTLPAVNELVESITAYQGEAYTWEEAEINEQRLILALANLKETK